jgi:hypothetical protein
LYVLEPHIEAYEEMTQRSISGELYPKKLKDLLTLLWLPEEVVDKQVSDLEIQRAQLDAVRQKRLTKR